MMWRLQLSLLAAILITVQLNGAPIALTRSGTGADAAAIQAIVDQYRADLGDPNNGATPGTQPGGRREISWDGGGAAAPVATFPSPMETFAARGSVFTTPGTGFSISGQPTPEFGNINPTYPDIFTAFSSPRLFAPLGSNITDVFFSVPGTTVLGAKTRGFGAVFTDVDDPSTTTMDFYDTSDNLIESFTVSAFNNGLSFLGVSFDNPIIARVRITTGNSALGPNDGSGVDVVAMDDFIYAEPTTIPEPSTLSLLAAGALSILAFRRRR
jgi:hypothetical protein